MGKPVPPDNTAIREAVSEGFRAYTQDAESRHVAYKLGVKDGKTEIDCAGFIEKAVREVFDGHLTNGDKLVLKKKNQNHVFDCGADDQIAEVSRKTGVLLQGEKVNLSTLKEGMIVGLDTGPVAWAKDRTLWNNISHIVLIYKDPATGALMVGQSSGTGKGVTSKPLKEWYNKVHDAGITLYATDVAKLAENIDATPVGNPAVMLATAAKTGAQAVNSFLGAFPDVSGAFGISAPRPVESAKAPAVKKSAPAAPKPVQ